MREMTAGLDKFDTITLSTLESKNVMHVSFEYNKKEHVSREPRFAFCAAKTPPENLFISKNINLNLFLLIYLKLL